MSLFGPSETASPFGDRLELGRKFTATITFSLADDQLVAGLSVFDLEPPQSSQSKGARERERAGQPFASYDGDARARAGLSEHTHTHCADRHRHMRAQSTGSVWLASSLVVGRLLQLATGCLVAFPYLSVVPLARNNLCAIVTLPDLPALATREQQSYFAVLPESVARARTRQAALLASSQMKPVDRSRATTHSRAE